MSVRQTPSLILSLVTTPNIQKRETDTYTKPERRHFSIRILQVLLSSVLTRYRVVSSVLYVSTNPLLNGSFPSGL